MRPKIDCAHPVANHQHGTRIAYVLDKCRCPDCTRASTEYNAYLRRQRAYGRSNLVDAEPARQHILALGSRGMGWKRVAHAAGIAPALVGGILYGDSSNRRPPRRRIMRRTSERILSVTFTQTAGGLVSAVGTQRRLRALVAIGWSMKRIGVLLGTVNMHDLMRQPSVQAQTADRVRKLYDRIWNQKPPHTNHRDLIAYRRSINFARSQGWPPPLAWDDDRIDDPTTRPSGVRIEAA